MMNAAPAIRLDAVNKTYKHYDRPLDRLREVVARRKLHSERTSVANVSFSVARGEVVGIIGRNGAGKSTLLKMIAGRLEPTSGSIYVNGLISAILELGTGFHPDLTGRENVRVGGLCLGLTKRQIEAEMQNIIDFAELEDSIDMPFRTYSSGMQARLTFATAVIVDPDILIIDEALSVGDNKFQLKSFNRIRSFRERGKTILLVTHSMGSVTAFCDRAILMDRGQVIADGEPNWVTSVYHHLQFGNLDEAIALSSQARSTAAQSPQEGEAETLTAPIETPLSDDVAAGAEIKSETATAPDNEDGAATFLFADPARLPPMQPDTEAVARATRQGYRYGDGRARIDGVAIVDSDGERIVRELLIGKVYQMVMDVCAQTPISKLYCGFLIRDVKGDILFGSDTTLGDPFNLDYMANVEIGGRRRIIAKFTTWLAEGDYFVTAAATAEVGKQSDMWFDAFEFRVVSPKLLQHTNSRAFLEPQFAILPIATTPADEATP